MRKNGTALSKLGTFYLYNRNTLRFTLLNETTV